MGRNDEASAEQMPHLAASVLSDFKEQDIEIAFPDSHAGVTDTEDFTRQPEFTFKHIVALISLTFLLVSAAAPFFMILSSLSMSVPLYSNISLSRSRPWRRGRGILVGHVEYVGHRCRNPVRGSHQ
jgi:hypothetical protein